MWPLLKLYLSRTVVWLQSFARCRGLALLLLLLAGGLLIQRLSKKPVEPTKIQVDPMEEKRKIPVQYGERDIADYNLYYTELVEHLPLFSFSNLNNVFSQVSKVPKFSATKPVILVVTPTYTRRLQKAELTNMCNTMRHSDNIFWIVIEDSLQKTELVKQFLLHCGMPAVHMNFKSYFEPQYTIDQRNAAIEWIKRNTNSFYDNTVLYFADDDNTYDPEIFEEMRYTRRVSIWPVGLMGHVWAEGPIVRNGKVLDWASHQWVHERKFPIDMAGFAVNFRFISDKPAAKFRHDINEGFMETTFLETLGIEDMDLEPRADNCTRVLVWHTQSRPPTEGVVAHTKRGSVIPDMEV